MNAPRGKKRFYKSVTVESAESGWQIALDGRVLRTPAGAPMVIAQRPLADVIAEEWHSQAETIHPDTMPMFRFVATSIDRVGPRRADIVAVSLKFAETDLLCYRADDPPDLVRRQSARWQPQLDWASDSLGATLRVTDGVVPVTQPVRAMAALERAMEELDDLALTAVSAAAAATGSLVLAFALARGQIDAAAAAEISLLDELFQAEQWGEDAEAAHHRTRIKAEIEEAARFLALIA